MFGSRIRCSVSRISYVNCPSQLAAREPIVLQSLLHVLWSSCHADAIRAWDAARARFWDSAVRGCCALQFAIRRGLSARSGVSSWASPRHQCAGIFRSFVTSPIRRVASSPTLTRDLCCTASLEEVHRPVPLVRVDQHVDDLAQWAVGRLTAAIKQLVEAAEIVTSAKVTDHLPGHLVKVDRILARTLRLEEGCWSWGSVLESREGLAIWESTREADPEVLLEL